MNKINSYYIGLDIGGTKIETILIKEVSKQSTNSYQVENRFFEEMDRLRLPTEREKGYSFVLSKISKLILSILNNNKVNLNDLMAIGIGLPGSINPNTSIMINGNSQIFIDKDVVADLKKSLPYDRSIFIDNDANLFALAETFWGAGKTHEKNFNVSPKNQISVGIILGTGCGGGVVVRGEQLKGRNGGGAEIGHTVLINDGVPCYCKRHGCAEQYLSGTGLENMYKEKYNESLKGSEIFNRLDRCEKSKDIVAKYIKYLSLFVTNLTNTFDPDYLVLGGGVSNQDYLYPILNKENLLSAFILDSGVKVYKHVLGDSAGVLGAALLPILKQ